jgi:hypothetical protein
MKKFTKIASFIFGVVAVAHLVRLFVQFQVMIGSHIIPMWVSVLGIIVAGTLSYGLWKESK